MGDWNIQRNQMVDGLCDRGVVNHSAVERAFRSVPRHVFLPADDAQFAYTHGAIVTKVRDGVPISASSEPAVMATMIKQLNLDPGARVLEVGAGTGYNAAILAEMVGLDGIVTTVDLDEDTCATARDNLARAGYAGVQVECRDGALGIPENAPFDRIIVTVGVYEISPHWVNQLKPGGIMLVPLWIRGAQCLVAFEMLGETLRSRSVRSGGFMRMRGALAGPESYVTLPSGWMSSAETPAGIDVGQIEHLLAQELVEHVALAGQFGSSLLAFSIFIASHDPRVLVLGRNDDTGHMSGYAVGLFDACARSLCLAMSISCDAEAGRTYVRSYGAAAMHVAMERHLERWTSLGGPGIEQLQVMANPVAEAGNIGHPQATIRGSFVMRFSWASDYP